MKKVEWFSSLNTKLTWFIFREHSGTCVFLHDHTIFLASYMCYFRKFALRKSCDCNPLATDLFVIQINLHQGKEVVHVEVEKMTVLRLVPQLGHWSRLLAGG